MQMQGLFEMKNAIEMFSLIKGSLRSFVDKVEKAAEKLPSVSVKKDLSGSNIRFDWPAWWKQMQMKNDGLCGIEANNWPGHYCCLKKGHDGWHGHV